MRCCVGLFTRRCWLPCCVAVLRSFVLPALCPRLGALKLWPCCATPWHARVPAPGPSESRHTLAACDMRRAACGVGRLVCRGVAGLVWMGASKRATRPVPCRKFACGLFRAAPGMPRQMWSKRKRWSEASSPCSTSLPDRTRARHASCGPRPSSSLISLPLATFPSPTSGLCPRLRHRLLTLYWRPPGRFLARHATRVSLKDTRGSIGVEFRRRVEVEVIGMALLPSRYAAPPGTCARRNTCSVLCCDAAQANLG